MAARKKIKYFHSEFTDDKKDSIHPEKKSESTNLAPDIVIKPKKRNTAVRLQSQKIYCKSASVENNATATFKMICRSAEQGNIEAQFKLGDTYALGYGTAKSLPDSYKWYTKAAIQGYKKALIRIQNLFQEDIRMRCRGQLNSGEEEWASDDFKKQNKIRELYEYRLEQNKSILNGAIDYYTKQFKEYQLSDQSDVDVQLNLAFLYQHGYGTKKCSRWAFEYYSLAAEQGNADAQYNLGLLYQQHTDKKFNNRDAFKWYTKAAEGGQIAAQRCLAYFYLKGLTTDIDYEKAVFCYSKAAASGDSQAQVTLGLLYRKGDYVKQDLPEAIKWYILAARKGNIVALNCLSQLYQRGMLKNIELEEDILQYLTEESMNSRLCSKLSLDISKIEGSTRLKQLIKLAKHALTSDGPAMYEIGLKYYHGKAGFAQDKDTGIRWIKKAAKREHKDAQFMMAGLYEKGDSIEQDYYKSSIWYRILAKQKDSDAQCKVGSLYNKGLGVRKDPLEASKWFTWAMDQENSDAQFYFGELRLFGHGIQQDVLEADKLFEQSLLQKNIQVCNKIGADYFIFSNLEADNKEGLKLLEYAAIHGHFDAQLHLGDAYGYKESPYYNIPKSIKFYTMAADSGSAEAKYRLGIIYLIGDDINPDYLKAYNLFKQASDKNHYDAKKLFHIPIVYDYDIHDYSKVINMFIEVTESGIENLAYLIGSIYEYGVMDAPSDSETFYKTYDEHEKWYLYASNKGDSRADYRLGVMCETGYDDDKELIKAIDHYNKAAEKDNGDAMYRLACMYLNEYGIYQDLLKAFCLYTRASIMGCKRATKVLMLFKNQQNALSYSDYVDYDFNMRIDTNKVINMLKEATKKGYTRLQYELGLMYERTNDYRKAFKWLSLAAEIGVTDAYYRLGVLYEEGKGIEQSYKLAADLYKKATVKDHEGACFRLGQLFQYGNGVKLDYLKAYWFYKKAAEMNHEKALKVLNITLESTLKPNGNRIQNFFDFSSKEYQDSLTMYEYVAEYGNPEVQFKVGYVYENNCLEPNYARAFKWYSIAAQKSHKAMYHLGLLFEKGLGTAQNYRRAIQLYDQASQFGNDDAIYRLGTVYHYGKGVDIDPENAIKYYTLSAKLGNPEYQCELGCLYEEGELVRKNPVETLKWYTIAYLQGYDEIASHLRAIYNDKPYEKFFFQNLFQVLSIASRNNLSLNNGYKYNNYGNINNRLGAMCYFGIGTDKNLEQSLQYFLKKYSDKERISIVDFCLFEYDDINSGQKINMLKEIENNKECMDQLCPEELYLLGMMFYDGRLQAKNLYYDRERGIYTPCKNQNLNDSSQHIVVEKDYPRALSYLKKAADKKHLNALFQLGIMYHFGNGVEKDNRQGDDYFKLVPHDNSDLMWKIVKLYHIHDEVQDFSMALKYYNHLKDQLVEDTVEDTVVPESDNANTSGPVQIGLGLLYEYGDGVKQDYKIAFDYYKKAVDNKYPTGYLRLGLMYYYGKGVPLDYKEAFELFRWFPQITFPLDKFPYVYEKNSLPKSDDVDSKKKRVYCTQTKEEIERESCYYQGLMYKYGQGVAKNEELAKFYLKVALSHGCQRAANEIKED